MRPRRRSIGRQSLESYLATALGKHRIVREYTRPHGTACVLQVVDATGTWVAKRHSTLRAFRREVRAYQLWVQALGDYAPLLHRADESERVLILTAIPGRPSSGLGAHLQAGALLRHLHDAEPPRPSTRAYAEACMERLDRMLAHGADMFDVREIDFVRSELRGLHSLPLPDRVPCHLDFTASNWLVDKDGTLRVVDFAGARLQPWVRDLNRLYFGEWWATPEYGAAFMASYGRDLTGDDLEFLRRTGALTAVSRVLWGAEHGLPTPMADGRRILRALMSGQR